ncbi:MAG: ABC transporter ATP-binding protein [Betaproteobacteria bacterium RIFCSPLOWO2_12_FULL_67_28]|nr:MAG: ABC transporter ATP-binding protein [Betaproteobacteria bacterium RIFCSPLOWO2_12_FULL_67_28]
MPPEKALSRPVLSTSDLNVHYGKVHAVQGVSLEVRAGEVVALLGANGAGKSSIIRSLVGLTPASGGRILLRDRRIDGLSSEVRSALGMAYVPEGRRVFGDLTVRDNLLMGAYLVKDRAKIEQQLEEVFGLFPGLRERHRQIAATLSGGEQQMLAIGRALVREPEVLILDEPSLGLAPVMIKVIYETLKRIRERGMTLLLAEQSAHIALKIADRAYVLETGRVTHESDAASLRSDPALRESYLGA